MTKWRARRTRSLRPPERAGEAAGCLGRGCAGRLPSTTAGVERLACIRGAWAMPTIEGAESWAQGLEELAHRIAPRFGRAEPRRRALVYLRGLLAPLERKNGWQLAEAAGDAT